MSGSSESSTASGATGPRAHYDGITTLSSINGGSAHYCGILTTGATKCWGRDGSGEVSGTPVTPLKAVRAGSYASCGVRSDNSRLICWPQHILPDALTTVAFSSIDGGAGAEWCGVRADTSKVECWGNSSLVNNSVPTGVTFSQVSVGQDAACGIRLSDGQAQCWGHPLLWCDSTIRPRSRSTLSRSATRPPALEEQTTAKRCAGD